MRYAVFYHEYIVVIFLNNMHSFKQETDLTGLLHLVKFYKSRRFDPDIGLPRLFPFFALM
jgi:hypothetical protein